MAAIRNKLIYETVHLLITTRINIKIKEYCQHTNHHAATLNSFTADPVKPLHFAILV